jgi:hypothetical protein
VNRGLGWNKAGGLPRPAPSVTPPRFSIWRTASLYGFVPSSKIYVFPISQAVGQAGRLGQSHALYPSA